MVSDKELEKESLIPKIFHKKNSLNNDQAFDLQIFLIEFDNGIIATFYDTDLKLGSLSMGYPIDKIIEKYSIFQGKHSELSDMVSLYISKKTQKVVYCSVHLNQDTFGNFERFKQLVDDYLET